MNTPNLMLVRTWRPPGYETVACVVLDVAGMPGVKIALHRSVDCFGEGGAPWVCSEYFTGLRVARGHTIDEAWERGLAFLADQGEDRIRRAVVVGLLLEGGVDPTASG